MGKTALQMYSLRHLTATDLVGTLKKVAEMGFEGVEFAGYFGMSANELAALLKDLGMEAAGSHTGFKELTENLPQVIDFSLTLGQKYVVCPSLPREYFQSKDALLGAAEIFNGIGTRLLDEGLVFGYHNHSYEFEPVEGECGFELLYNNVDPELVKMELDTCWAENAGYPSVDIMKKYVRHFKLLHIKELPKSGDPHDREVIGQGLMDFPAICKLGETMGCPWYIIEHENQQGDIEGDIDAGLQYLKSLL